IAVGELSRRIGGILGDVDHHRTRPAGSGNVECLLDYHRDVFRVLDHEAVLHNGPGNADHVGFLETVGADQRAVDLARDHDHRNGVHKGGRDACHSIGRAGTGSHQHHAGATSRASVAIGGMGSSLLVTYKDVFNLVLPENRV